MIDQDERWQALQDALAVGDEGDAADDFDLRAEPQWRDELDFYDALANHTLADAEPHPNDEALIDAALAAVPVEEAEPTTRRPYGWLAAVVAIAALAVLWLAWPGSVELRGAEGTWATEAGDSVATGELIPSQTWLRVTDEACMAHGEARLCAQDGARLRVRSADEHALELSSGSVRVDAGTWTVTSAGEAHVLEAGNRLEAAIEKAIARAEVPTAPKAVEPAPEAVEPTPDDNGESGDVVADVAKPATSRKSPARPRADAATLIARARTARGEGRLSAAERSYEELLRRFPKSAEARAGRVSLAQVKLRRGKSKAALRLFTAAAKAGGPLAEDAAWGRIQALHKLGRTGDLRQAVDAFSAKYPTSAYRARAQGLLAP